MALRTAIILFLVATGAFWAAAAADPVFGVAGARAALSGGCFILAAVYGYLTAPRRPM